MVVLIVCTQASVIQFQIISILQEQKTATKYTHAKNKSLFRSNHTNFMPRKKNDASSFYSRCPNESINTKYDKKISK